MLPSLIHILSYFSAVKHPFLRYQLAMAVVEQAASSKAKSHPSTDNILTPEGLGVPERTFFDLEVIAIYSRL
jgi:hypothetical protein